MTYEELIISFEQRGQTEEGDRRYQAAVRHSALPISGGPFYRTPAEANTVWATQIQAVQDEYADLIDLAHQISADTAVPYFDQQSLLDLGRAVTAVLPKLTKLQLTQATMRARHRGQGLRITIAVHQNARALLGVPWELLALPLSTDDCSTENEAFLLLDPRFILVRQVLGVGRISPAVFERPLRFQSFVAEPRGVPPIRTEAITQKLKQYAPDLKECWYTGPRTLEEIHLRLRRYTPQILHLLCHGSEGSTQIETRHDLLLTHDNGNIRRTSVFELAPVVMQAENLRLVVLQACYGGADTVEHERKASESVALGLLRHGVPFVIAFQGEAEQKPAAAFIDELFCALAEGSSVEQAVARGRAAMLVAEGVVDWSLPVLYSGHAQPEPRTIFHRLADSIPVTISNPVQLQTIRGLMIALALCLIVAAFTRWLLLSDGASFSLGTQLPAILALWLSSGLVCPALIALLHRGMPDHTDSLDKVPPREVQLAKWTGAYLGYAMGCIIGLLFVGVLYGIGFFALIPASLQIGLAIIIVLWALLCSYSSTRMFAQNVFVLYNEIPETFGFKAVGLLLLVAFSLLFGAPYVLAWMTSAWFPSLNHPAPAALLLVVLLLALVVAGDTSA